ncbi:MAG: secondary thiamine-phosphate synthase enzyme YjbQ [Dehalococcoidia bacterium]|jgi:secondary thiamine-phosphate synthase enzyme|nr:secondary thiamine-phosphate synthase enzyme YjbQ [Dehalococcoidia bacterium]MDP6510837.1 secondary thiamine-phosphate synthase enzyme YjbQ [Dehalococcoidia bacterium]MDP6783055.1 secondary thiamine-phosphate synthase enzyme YjbQ [Dehalococcoidia bacterium]
MVVTREITLDTQGRCHLVDITLQVAAEVARSGVRDGIVNIFVVGSTAGVGTTENEPGLLRDTEELWERLVASDTGYHHDLAWGDGNGFSHLRAGLMGPSLTIPFSAGKMALGTWQQVVLADFDNRPRHRQVVLQIMGE